jgi:hypothetical protein
LVSKRSVRFTAGRASSSEWSPEFLARLRQVDNATVAAVDELLHDVRQARRSKAAREL